MQGLLDAERQVGVGRRGRARAGGLDRLEHELVEAGIRLLDDGIGVERLLRRRQAAELGREELVARLADAHGRLEGLVLVLGVGAHREVQAAERRRARLGLRHAREARRGDVLEHVRRVLLRAGEDEGVVDHEARAARLEGDAALVLGLRRLRGIGERGPRRGLHDLERGARRAVGEVDLRRAREDPSPRGLHERVEPDDVALGLRGLDLDHALTLPELARLVEHLLPGPRCGVDAVLAVPEQLGVRGVRRGVQAVLVGPRLHGGGDRSLTDPLGLLLGEGQDPLRLGELAREDDVERGDVDRRVLGGQAAGELLALVVGVGRELLDPDPVAPFRLLVAVLHGGLERPAGSRGERVEVERRRPARASRTARGDDHGQHREHGDRYDPPPHEGASPPARDG